MKKLLFVAAALVVVSLSSCKKEKCKLSSETISCEDFYGSSCGKIQKDAFKTYCKAANGKMVN